MPQGRGVFKAVGSLNRNLCVHHTRAAHFHLHGVMSALSCHSPLKMCAWHNVGLFIQWWCW